MSMLRRTLLLMAFVLLAACAGAPETRLTEAQLATLVRGKTTLAEVTSSFGPPSRTEKADGGTRVTYGWTVSRDTNATVTAGGTAAGTAEIQRREILLTFTSDHVLKDFEGRTLTTRSGNFSALPPP